jgi:hypothetical protein
MRRCSGPGSGFRPMTSPPARPSTAVARAPAPAQQQAPRGGWSSGDRGAGAGARLRALPTDDDRDDRDDRTRFVEVEVAEVTRSLPRLESESQTASLVSTPTDEKVLNQQAVRTSLVRPCALAHPQRSNPRNMPQPPVACGSQRSHLPRSTHPRVSPPPTLASPPHRLHVPVWYRRRRLSWPHWRASG